MRVAITGAELLTCHGGTDTTFAALAKGVDGKPYTYDFYFGHTGLIDIFGDTQGRDLGAVSHDIEKILAETKKDLPRGLLLRFGEALVKVLGSSRKRTADPAHAAVDADSEG